MTAPGPPQTPSRSARREELGPVELLAVARRYVDVPDPAVDGSWARIAAFLTRRALEQSLRDLWQADPDLAPVHRATARSQLICLHQLAELGPGPEPADPPERSAGPVRPWVDPSTAADAAHTWAALCRACHYHPYELPPTVAELTCWIGAVDRFRAEADAVVARWSGAPPSP